MINQLGIGNITLGNQVAFNVFISLANSQKCWIHTVIQNIVYLNGGVQLGCTLNITTNGPTPQNQATYTVIQGSNVTGNFN